MNDDLFFVCSLVEYVARTTMNHGRTVINAMGRDAIAHYLELSDVYHCENLDKLTDEIVTRYGITHGTRDYHPTDTEVHVPTVWDMGKVYSRLIVAIAEVYTAGVIDTMFMVYNSWLAGKIDDYDCSMFYENNSYLTACFNAGYALA